MHDIKADRIQVNKLDTLEEDQIKSAKPLAYETDYTDFEDLQLPTKKWVELHFGAPLPDPLVYTQADLIPIDQAAYDLDPITYAGGFYLPVDTDFEILIVKIKDAASATTNRLGPDVVEENTGWATKRIYQFPDNASKTITIKI